MSKNTMNTKSKMLAFLDVKLASKSARATKGTTTKQGEINKFLNETCHKALVTSYPEYYKRIECDVLKVDKEGKVVDVVPFADWAVLIPQDEITLNGKKVVASWRVSEPSSYLKGDKTSTVCYYKENGKHFYFDDKAELIAEKLAD